VLKSPPLKRMEQPAEGRILAISPEEFAALTIPLGPFERSPRLAVAVSGGADSLALALLADRWVRERDGTVLALTVDHGLRPEAAAEAQQVALWLEARGIAHRTLHWQGPYPAKGRQAAARNARYRLLEEACAEAGIFHLLLAHHREDQAETFLLRLARGSGLSGLAGMAAVVELRSCRLLRPLLTVPRARLAASLEAAGQDWIEDPSNRNPVYARVRLRRSAALLATEGLTPRRLSETATRLSRSRAAVEDSVARCIVRTTTFYPAGFAQIAPTGLTASPREVGLRALAALLATVGGESYTPRLDRLERLYDRISTGSLATGVTLGGCRILTRRGTLLICREPAAVAEPVEVVPGKTIPWDGRFVVEASPDLSPGLTLGALGGEASTVAKASGKAAEAIPAAVRPTLPAIRDLEGVVLVPHLPYERSGLDGLCGLGGLRVSFRPIRPLSTAGFTVV